MKIEVLKTIFENKSDYYLVAKDDCIILCFIECTLPKVKMFSQITIGELEKFLKS